ncbi:4-hydroxy-4-methyl-2-oxoglutarate aldolase [Drechslerella dactyloides]|uniref:4-hydroxy-4-methyl-2-oxoglutarate aldolase n=1 Tax=Drechslerella dactyloides TaxID=74499 RepID=A0AAD6IW28_DREDA|nr:4-hydroxy-4-methyl-2-oxoglutarate aldolase [Drechslerella dactyloides]
MSLDDDKIEALSAYNACDISDALLKLKVPGAGFLADIILHTPNHNSSFLTVFSSTIPRKPLIAPAHTVLFAPKHTDAPPTTLHPNTHFADLTPSSAITVISQPAGQRNAVLGGLVAGRIQALGGVGVVVDGRIRDVGELVSLGLHVWAKGTSTVGAGAEARCVGVGGEIEVEGVKINSGDIIFADPVNGVVCIPKDKLDAVLDLLPKITGADEKVRADILEKGSGLQEAFTKHRQGI